MEGGWGALKIPATVSQKEKGAKSLLVRSPPSSLVMQTVNKVRVPVKRYLEGVRHEKFSHLEIICRHAFYYWSTK